MPASEERARAEENAAVIERIKSCVGLWQDDTRMRIAREIYLREIARCQEEERAKTARSERRSRSE